VEFLTEAGLADGRLERALTVLDEQDVSSVDNLRRCFAEIKSQLTAMARGVIGEKLAADKPLQLASQLKIEPPAAVSLVAFNVLIQFKAKEITCRLPLAASQFTDLPVHGVLQQLNVLAQQHLVGEYSIVGLLLDGVQVFNGESLSAQAVQPGTSLTAKVQPISAMHALAAATGRPKPKVEAAPKPPRASNCHFLAKPHAPPAAPTAAAQQGSTGTHTGAKRGPSPNAPKIDKKAKPLLWTASSTLILSAGADLTPRMNKMAEKVKADYGVPAADGRGVGIWCLACMQLQPLQAPFELQAWRTRGRCRIHGRRQGSPHSRRRGRRGRSGGSAAVTCVYTLGLVPSDCDPTVITWRRHLHTTGRPSTLWRPHQPAGFPHVSE
jgi:hypothetical protein